MTDELSVVEEEAILSLLVAKTVTWGEGKGLLGPDAQPGKQLGKVKEEVTELSEAFWEWDSYTEEGKLSRAGHEAYEHALMELGDVVVTLVLLSRQLGSSLSECLEMAYEKIKGRTGVLVDGVFVKSEDLVKE